MSHALLAAGVCFAVHTAAAIDGNPPADPRPSEQQAKAAFLSKFAKYVEWPTNTFFQPDDPIYVGILGEDPFGEVLDKTVDGKLVEGRPIRIRRLEATEDATCCHLVFVGTQDERGQRDALERVRCASVLTVGEGESFLAQGGMISFVMKDNQVRFHVNLNAARQAGLKVSSKLLALAEVVEGKEDETRK
jgi:hypothetical protein